MKLRHLASIKRLIERNWRIRARRTCLIIGRKSLHAQMYKMGALDFYCKKEKIT